MSAPTRGAPAGQAESSVATRSDKAPLVTLARRWRVLRLGCPRGCGSYHEPPCHLAQVRR
jgi:hypothetical protein